MIRKPMSEETKKKLSEKAKARAIAKQVEGQNVSLPPVEHVITGAAFPHETEGKPKASIKGYAEHLEDVQRAAVAVRAIHADHPDMIEAKQALDALDGAVHHMRKVLNTLDSR